MEAEVKSYEELLATMAEHREQMKQVEELLLMDPENEELQDMYNSLQEVITLTEDLLREAQQHHASGEVPSSSAVAAPSAQPSTAGDSTLERSQVSIPQQLSAQQQATVSMNTQIKAAQARAALLGQAPLGWAVGASCLAKYSVDGEWYPALVESVTEDGKLVVAYEGYGNKEELPPSEVQPTAVPDSQQEVYQGVAAPKRHKVVEEQVVKEMPKWMEVKPGDDPKTVERKKKLIKSWKSKLRFQEMDLKQKEKASNWQSFLKGKGVKKKTGFFTGRKKESMFKVPEGVGAKVGVIGSGQGMTEYKKAGKHEFQLDT